MEKKKRSKERQEVLKKIKRLEAEGRFDEGVEPDLPAPELLPSQVDYLCEKVSSRGKRFVANFLADRYFLRLIRKGMMVIDGIVGEEHLAALQNGAVVTCNHFSPFDHYIVFHCIRRHLPKKYLYKIIREEKKTALLITHDISEAISVADKIFVLSKRPATVVAEHTISFPENEPLKRRENKEFSKWFELLWKELNV